MSLIVDYSSSDSENNHDVSGEIIHVKPDEKPSTISNPFDAVNYETDSDSEESQPPKSESNLEISNVNKSDNKTCLQFPNVKNSVFSNPFKQVDEAEKSILEKHVKMTDITPKSYHQDGSFKKNICRDFHLHGKCKFGYRCKFIHETCEFDMKQIEKNKNNKRIGSGESKVPAKKCHFD